MFEGANRLDDKARKASAVVTVLIAASLLAAPALALMEPEAEPESTWSAIADGAAVGFDAVVLRPLHFSRMLVGAVAFIPAAMFAEVAPIMGGDAASWKATEKEVWDLFVYEAAEATFMTPLGAFRHSDDF